MLFSTKINNANYSCFFTFHYGVRTGKKQQQQKQPDVLYVLLLWEGQTERERESERCETCALRCSLCGHEASSRQRDSAVLVSLMTAAEPDNDQEPASLFAGVHLLAESPRKEVFFYFLIVIFWVVFFPQLWSRTARWAAGRHLFPSSGNAVQRSGHSKVAEAGGLLQGKCIFYFSFNVTKASHFMDNNVLVVRSVVRRKWNEFNEREGRRHNPTPPPSTSASKTCTQHLLSSHP